MYIPYCFNSTHGCYRKKYCIVPIITSDAQVDQLRIDDHELDVATGFVLERNSGQRCK
jgi:hypothetical protein